jgi:hypothetical protein
LYFKIADTNLDGDKSIALNFLYGSGKTSFPTPPTIYQANGEPAASVTGGKVYYIYLPNEVLTALAGESDSSLELTVRVTTSIGGNTIGSGEDTIDLRVVDLFSLR